MTLFQVIKSAGKRQHILLICLFLAMVSIVISSVLAWRLGVEVNRYNHTLKFKLLSDQISDNMRDYSVIASVDSYVDSNSDILKEIPAKVSQLFSELESLPFSDESEKIYLENMQELWNTLRSKNFDDGMSFKESITYFDDLIRKHETSKLSREEPQVINSLSVLVMTLASLSLFFIFIIVFTFISIIRESLQRKKIIQELSHAKENALRASQLKDEFLATVSHEVRTPLNGIIGISTALLREELSEKHMRLVKTIDSSGKILLRIINDMLDFSKMERAGVSVHLRTFCLMNLVQEVVDTLSLKASEKGNQIRINYPKEKQLVIKSDPDHITQILFNIIGNANKFTNEGYIDINVSFAQESGSCEGEQVPVQIVIRDTGDGIESAKLEHIFKPFTQAHKGGTSGEVGTGLGLAITKKLVKALNGEIRLDSVVGLGTKVFINLPVTIANQAAPELVSNNFKSQMERSSIFLPSYQFSERIKILVVEDNHANQIVACELFQNMGAAVDVVSSGEDCLRAVDNARYDLILMDCQMPVMDGYECTQRLRQASSAIPIIAMTASVQKKDVERCFSIGMNGFIKKPILIDKAYSEIVRVLKNHKSMIDSSVLDKLGEQMGNEVAQKVLSAYLDNLDEMQAALKEISGRFNRDSKINIQRLAHKMKSSSLTLGAQKLADYCALIEDTSVESITSESLDELDRLCYETRISLKSFLFFDEKRA